jgi:hypothetical protein
VSILSLTNVLKIKLCVTVALGISVVACSTAKLEARLEANPQCKEVVNPKTGAVMPCPGTDKAFYKSVGLEPTKATPTAANTPSSPAESAAPQAPNQATQPISTDCKPTLHKKTGGILPCPSSN